MFALLIYSNYGYARQFGSPGPGPYQEEKITKAIEKHFGTKRSIINGGIIVKTPIMAANLGNVSLRIESTVPLQKILILFDANDDSYLATLLIPEDYNAEDINYLLSFGMQNPGYVVVVGEGKDGNLYFVKNLVQ